MKHILKSLKYLKNFAGNNSDKLPVKNGFLNTGSFHYDIYEPKNPKHTILLVHGMVPDGNRDYRIIHISRALADCGYRIVAPYYDAIADLSIDPESINQIRETIEYFTNIREFCPSGKIAILSASISAGFSLIASAESNLAGRVSSMFLMGTYGNVESVIKHVMEEDDIDDYGRMIILKNFYCSTFNERNELEKVFEISAHDNIYNREIPLAAESLKNLTEEERITFQYLQSNSNFRKEKSDAISKKYRHLFKDLSVLDSLKDLQASVTLIHGMDDPVIPSSESVLIFNKLTSLKIPAKLCLTPLISHSDTTFGIKVIPATIKAVLAFAYFLKRIH